MKLTKDAQKLLAYSYKEYLQNRKQGKDKKRAKYISNELMSKNFPKLSSSDYLCTVTELCQSGGGKRYADGSFELSDEAIVFMENKFSDDLKGVIGFISQLIP